MRAASDRSVLSKEEVSEVEEVVSLRVLFLVRSLLPGSWQCFCEKAGEKCGGTLLWTLQKGQRGGARRRCREKLGHGESATGSIGCSRSLRSERAGAKSVVSVNGDVEVESDDDEARRTTRTAGRFALLFHELNLGTVCLIHEEEEEEDDEEEERSELQQKHMSSQVMAPRNKL